jgi:hypothetical protein
MFLRNVGTYKSAQRHNTDQHLHLHCRENFKRQEPEHITTSARQQIRGHYERGGGSMNGLNEPLIIVSSELFSSFLTNRLPII